MFSVLTQRPQYLPIPHVHVLHDADSLPVYARLLPAQMDTLLHTLAVGHGLEWREALKVELVTAYRLNSVLKLLEVHLTTQQRYDLLYTLGTIAWLLAEHDIQIRRDVVRDESWDVPEPKRWGEFVSEDQFTTALFIGGKPHLPEVDFEIEEDEDEPEPLTFYEWVQQGAELFRRWWYNQ
jgi:hypothetical protein